jgi:hypothetical protein
VQEQVEDLGLGEEIGDGAVEVVAEADVETEAMADGEGEDGAGEDILFLLTQRVQGVTVGLCPPLPA